MALGLGHLGVEFIHNPCLGTDLRDLERILRNLPGIARLRHSNRVALRDLLLCPLDRGKLSSRFGPAKQALLLDSRNLARGFSRARLPSYISRASPRGFGPGRSRELAANTAAQRLGGRFRFGSEG